MSKSVHFFICYAHADEAIVKEWIVDKLSVAHQEAWFDIGLVAGRNWKIQLAEKIEQSKGLIYVISHASNKSFWCQWELRKAINAGKRIVPILIQDSVNPPEKIKDLLYIDFSKGPTPETMASLIGSLQETSISQDQPVEEKTQKSPIGKLWDRVKAILSPEINTLFVILGFIVALIGLIFAILIFVITRNDHPSNPSNTPLFSFPSQVLSTSTLPPILNPTQTATPQPTNTPIPLIAHLSIDRTEEWMVVYIPPDNPFPLDLENLSFDFGDEVVNLSTYRPFREELGLPITEATCFVLRIDDEDVPRVPTNNCSNLANRQVFDHDTNGELYWYDRNSGDYLSFMVYLGDTKIGDCSNDPECIVSWAVLASPTETPPPIPVISNGDWTPIEFDFDGVTMVLVPAECFTLGSTDEQLIHTFGTLEEANPFSGDGTETPVNEICFKNPFWIDKVEVTSKQYDDLGGEGNTSSLGGPNHPRENLTWFQAKSFCEGRGARLPTESEWEYAGRGPENRIFPWGDDFVEDNVVYSSASHIEVQENLGNVSWVGAYDMAGNVYEWVSSLYFPYSIYKDTSYVDEDMRDLREDIGDITGNRVVKGGSYYDESAYKVRLAYRVPYPPEYASSYVGFRCARNYNGEVPLPEWHYGS